MDGSCQVSLTVLMDSLLAANLLEVLHPCVGPLRHATCIRIHTKLGVELTQVCLKCLVWKCQLSSTSIPSGNFLLCFPTKGDFTVFFRYLKEVLIQNCHLYRIFSFQQNFVNTLINTSNKIKTTHSQMSWPMVIPSAALFLLRLGDVSTSTLPFCTFSHCKYVTFRVKK